MDRLSAFVFSACLCLGGLFAQTSDIVVFSDAGEKFTLVVDGDVKNAAPATRVVASGIKNATPMLVLNFADAGIPAIRQNGYLEPGQEYTLRITMNKKGVRVLRPQGQAPLGTAASAEQQQSAPTDLPDEMRADNNSQTTTVSGNTMQSTTTITTTDEVGGQNANVSVNGMSVSMSVDGMNGNSTTTTTTSATTMASTPEMNEDPTAPEVVSSASGCAQAMGTTDFADAVTSIKSKGFEETKLTLAKQIGGSNCFTAAQVKTVMGLFGFEDSKLDFAKFAYDHTTDVNNYFKVNDAFGFSSSVDELNAYIQNR